MTDRTYDAWIAALRQNLEARNALAWIQGYAGSCADTTDSEAKAHFAAIAKRARETLDGVKS